MSVKRIVVNIPTASVETTREFYASVFGLETVMDVGWIATVAAGTDAPVQLSIASEGGSGTEVPDMSIEVNDVDAVYTRAKSLGHVIPYDITDEPWGVRPFYLLDPTGKTINVLSHTT